MPTATLPQTRPEQEAYVRQITRRCRGNMVFADEVLRTKYRDRLVYLMERAHAKSIAPTALRLLYEEMWATQGRTPPQPLPDNWWRAVEVVNNFLFSLRENCGADFNDVICAGPFDGKVHTYKCPSCGQEGIYIPPHFDEN